MSVHGAMAGAATGAARRRRIEDEIDQTFDTPETRQTASRLSYLIQVDEGGSAGIAIIYMLLGMPVLFGGASLGEALFGNNIMAAIGPFAGLALLTGLVWYVDYRFCRRPAQRELQQIVDSTPDGKLIETKVRAILANN